MKRIPLTQGQYALVDDEDYEWLNQWKWYAWWNPNSKTFYARRKVHSGKVNGKQKWKTIHMHRLIMDTPDGLQSHHKNHIGYDNQKSNLQNVTNRQNAQNRRGKQTSKYPGVYWHTSTKKWMARYRKNGEEKYLGLFDDEREAAKAYERVCRESGEELICKMERK